MNENNDPRLPRHFRIYGGMPAITAGMRDTIMQITYVPLRSSYGWHGEPPANRNRRGKRIESVKS